MGDHAGNLQGSAACYDSAPLRWQSGLRNAYTYRNAAPLAYNFRNNVPWDRNWGRSDVSCWAVGHAPPLNIVDATKTPQFYIEQLPSNYRYLPHFDPHPARAWSPNAGVL